MKFRPTAAGVLNLIANYAGYGGYTPATANYNLTVTAKPNPMKVSCTPTSVTAGSSTLITCTAKVIGFFTTGLPTGAVSWYQAPYVSAMGLVSFTSATCNLTLVSSTQGTCYVTMTGSRSGEVKITAEYAGDSNNQGGYGTATLTIKKAT